MTVTEPSGYLSVEVQPAGIVAKRGQPVYVECCVVPNIECYVTIVSVDLALFDSEGKLLRKQALDADMQQATCVRHTTYQIEGDEASYRLLVAYNVHFLPGDLGAPYSEYTVAAMPITITK
jgi:hypothetical protein